MKKLFTLVFALSLFVSLVSSAIVQKEAPEWYTTQYWVVTFSWGYYTFGEMVRDASDNPTQGIGIYTNCKKMEILRIRQKDGRDFVDLAYLEDGEVKWKPLKGRFSAVAYDDSQGSLFGNFFFEYELKRGEGIPAAKGYVAGTLRQFSFNKTRQSWIAGSGGGHAVFFNDPQDFPAWHLMRPATDVSSEPVLGMSASVTVAIYSYQTGMQIKRSLETAERNYSNPRRK